MKAIFPSQKSFTGLPLILLIVWTSMSSFKLDTDVEITLEKSPLEVHGDSIELSFVITIPSKMVSKKEIIEITPSIAELSFKKMTLKGEKSEGDSPIVNYVAGGKFNYTSKIKYDPSMLQQPVVINIVQHKGAKSKGHELVLNPGIITTSQLMINDDKPTYSLIPVKRITQHSQSAYVQFTPNKGNPSSNEWKKKEFIEIRHLLESIPLDESRMLTGIEIKSVIPPGNLKQNKVENLGDKRINSVLVQLTESLLENKELIKISYASEDPDQLNSIIKELYPDDANLISRIIFEADIEPSRRETELLNLLGKEKLDEVNSNMNRCIITVTYEEDTQPEERLNDKYLNDKDLMTAEELLMLSDIVSSIEVLKEISLFGSEKYPQDWRFKNNLACYYIEKNEINLAKELLENIRNQNQNTIESNYAIVLRRKGQLWQAKAIYESLPKDLKNVKYNSGLVYLQLGDYLRAAHQLLGKASINFALSLIMDEDFEGALSILDGLPNKGITHYLKAIALIRQNIRDSAIEELKKAIELDNNYKMKAKHDAEFYKLYDSRSFMSLFE